MAPALSLGVAPHKYGDGLVPHGKEIIRRGGYEYIKWKRQMIDMQICGDRPVTWEQLERANDEKILCRQ